MSDAAYTSKIRIERERYALKVLRGDFSRVEKQINDDDRAQSALNAVSA